MPTWGYPSPVTEFTVLGTALRDPLILDNLKSESKIRPKAAQIDHFG